MLRVNIVDAMGVVVEVVDIPDPRREYCRLRNEILPDGLRAVMPTQPSAIATDLAKSRSLAE